MSSKAVEEVKAAVALVPHSPCAEPKKKSSGRIASKYHYFQDSRAPLKGLEIAAGPCDDVVDVIVE